ncbi:MAG: hypothetical protein H0T71_08340 [Acidobacteria bacterium]|nr:hypothetical protein [Acidobacteriota bacterium]
MRSLLALPPAIARFCAQLLVVAMSVGALGPVLHGVHDEDCEPAFVVHDEAAHRFQSAAPDGVPFPGGEHCVACHFARSSRGPVSWQRTALITFVDGGLLSHADGHFVALVAAAPLPARAPPLV